MSGLDAALILLLVVLAVALRYMVRALVRAVRHRPTPREAAVISRLHREEQNR